MLINNSLNLFFAITFVVVYVDVLLSVNALIRGGLRYPYLIKDKMHITENYILYPSMIYQTLFWFTHFGVISC